MELYQHDHDFTIKINGQDLMSSRQYESELELARLGCAHLTGSKTPSAQVVVGELLSAVVEWNREFLMDLNGQPLKDKRVDIKTGDVVELISRSKNRFDAILLDIDNGPSSMSILRNRRLYGYEGIRACRLALREQGCLAVWSVESSKKYERLLMSGGFHVRRFRVPVYKGSKSQFRFVWIASKDKSILPTGGGEPHLPLIDESKESRRRRSRERY
jgi:spermidine synthase